jgi:hypothetical protein
MLIYKLVKKTERKLKIYEMFLFSKYFEGIYSRKCSVDILMSRFRVGCDY